MRTKTNGLRKELARLLSRALSFADESSGRRHGSSLVHLPVFIIGPPRSGTTLFYQCYVEWFQPAYFCNLAARWKRGPVTASWLARRLAFVKRKDFKSCYGSTGGFLGPHEGWPIWNRWFGTDRADDHIGAGELDDLVRHEMQMTVGGIERVFGQHFVSKNVKHSERILALNEVFPGCLFISLRRDPLANAQSLVEAWKKHNKEKCGWWSVKPRNFETFYDASLSERACKQLFFVEQDIKQDSRTIGSERLFFVDYEKLCTDPHSVMKSVEKFLGKHEIKFRTTEQIPRQFDVSTRDNFDPKEYADIKKHVDQLYPRSGSKCETIARS